jgi:hypothetical protein
MTVNRVAAWSRCIRGRPTRDKYYILRELQSSVIHVNKAIESGFERLGHVREINWAYVDGSKHETDNGPYTLARVCLQSYRLSSNKYRYNHIQVSFSRAVIVRLGRARSCHKSNLFTYYPGHRLKPPIQRRCPVNSGKVSSFQRFHLTTHITRLLWETIIAFPST